MKEIIVLLIIIFFFYQFLKPSKKRKNKTIFSPNNFQDLQQTLNTIEQQSKKSPPKTPPKPNTQIKQNPNSPPIKRQEQKEVQSLEKINIEVKNFDSQISASEFVETKKQNLSLENLDYVHDSQIYTEVTDTETSFQKENQKWVQQSLKDEQEATTLQRKKPRFNTKDIKKAYITNQILQQRYV